MPFKPYNTLHRLLSLNSPLTPAQKRDTERVVDAFIQQRIPPPARHTKTLMRHVHLANSGFFAFMATTINPLLGGLALLENATDHLLHVVALQKSQQWVKYAKRQGIQEGTTLHYGVQNFMLKQGGLVYSPLAVIRNSATLQAIAQGKRVNLVKGPLYTPIVKGLWKKLY
jgi:hypothetical protein